MYILLNAMKNLFRNKGRNILIAIVTLAIIISAVISLTISNTSAKIIDDIRLDIGSKVDISVDLFSSYGQEKPRNLSIDEYVSYSESDYLQNTIFNVSMPAWSGDFFAVDDAEKGKQTHEMEDGSGTINFPTLDLVGNSNPDTILEFMKNDREILPGGRMFAALNECIISEEIAKLNSVSVGDTIHIESVFPPVKDYTLTVVGIYSDITEEYENPQYSSLSFLNRRNEIIGSFDTVMAVGWDDSYGLDMSTEYYLKNPDDLSRFESEVRAKGLPSGYDVSINQDAYEKVSGPMSGLRGVAVTFMTVVLILGGIVLVLISYLAIKERKYEVGVLRAMGMEKKEIAFGIFLEAIMITALCLVIGLGIGSVAAQPIANSLLAGQVEVAEKAAAANDNGGKVLMSGGQTQTSDNASGYTPVSDIQVNLSADVIIQIIMIALVLAALSGVIGIIRITKYEPLKILRERN